MKTTIISMFVAIAFGCGVFIGRIGMIEKPCFDEGKKAYNLNCIIEIADIVGKYDTNK